MTKYISIVVAVDSIGALSDGTLEDHLFLMDNSPWESPGKGTDYLSTMCNPGRIIQWVIYPIDLQTPAAIKNITFLDACNKTMSKSGNARTEIEMPTMNSWTGIVPGGLTPGHPYKYRLEIQIGEGKNSILHRDTPSLMII